MNLLEDTLVLIYHYVTNYVTKTYLKNTTGIDASKLAAKSDLASLKAEVGKLVNSRYYTETNITF